MSSMPGTPATHRLVKHRAAPLLLGFFSAALLLPALWGGFQLDDHFQRHRLLGLGEPAIQLFVFYTGDAAENREQMEAGFMPWWSSQHMRHANLRYLSVLSMQLDYLLWPNSPFWMHAHSLLWLALLVAITLLFYRRLLPWWAAGLAGLLYALDDAHSLPAAYLANRNALIAAAFGVACLYCTVRWRQEQWRPGRCLAPLCLALALLAGELGVSTLAYLVAYLLTLDQGTATARARTFLPSALVTGLWLLWHRLGGFGSQGSGFYVDPLQNPVAFLQLLLDRASALLLGQWTPFPSDWATLMELGTAKALPLRIAGLLLLLFLLLLFSGTLKRRATCRFFALGSVLSLAPICAVGPQNRLLFFVGLGAMGMIACLVQDTVERWPRYARRKRLAIAAALTLLLLFHAVLAPVMAYFFLDLQNTAARRMETASNSVADETLAGKTVVLVNPSDSVYLTNAIPLMRLAEGRPQPDVLRVLGHGSSGMRLHRDTAESLIVSLDRGLFPDPFSRYYRSAEEVWAEGDLVELPGFSAEVISLDAAGDPSTIRYRFDKPLEESQYLWLRWDGATYSPWQPPKLGQSIRIEGQPGLFG